MEVAEMTDTIREALENHPEIEKVSGEMMLSIAFKGGACCKISVVVSRLAQLNYAKAMFDGGASQTDIRKAFGSTLGIKYYWICALDKRFPRLQILKRCRNGKLKIPHVHHRNLQMLTRETQSEVGKYFKRCAKCCVSFDNPEK